MTRRSVLGYALVVFIAFVYTFIPAAAQWGEQIGALIGVGAGVALLIVLAIGAQEAWHGAKTFYRWLTR